MGCAGQRLCAGHRRGRQGRTDTSDIDLGGWYKTWYRAGIEHHGMSASRATVAVAIPRVLYRARARMHAPHGSSTPRVTRAYAQAHIVRVTTTHGYADHRIPMQLCAERIATAHWCACQDIVPLHKRRQSPSSVSQCGHIISHHGLSCSIWTSSAQLVS